MEARPLPTRRGRPPGSPNKPKPPNIIIRDNPNVLQSHILEVSAGANIMESLNNYVRQRGVRVCVVNGSGTISNVIISNGTSLAGSVVTYYGPFEIVSITGMVPAPSGVGGLSILLSGGQGQLIGGNVNGPLFATSKVVLTVIPFTNVERLPLEDREGATREDTSGGASHGATLEDTGGGASHGGGASKGH